MLDWIEPRKKNEQKKNWNKHSYYYNEREMTTAIGIEFTRANRTVIICWYCTRIKTVNVSQPLCVFFFIITFFSALKRFFSNLWLSSYFQIIFVLLWLLWSDSHIFMEKNVFNHCHIRSQRHHFKNRQRMIMLSHYKNASGHHYLM